MATTSPSWFDTWAATFKDIEAAYLLSVPRQWPEGLYDDDQSDERKDLDSTAVVMSWVAQGGEWIKRRIFPQYDSLGQFLQYWEDDVFAISRAATIALRQQAVIAYCRLMLGTATKATIQKIMAPIFGIDAYTDIDFSFASRADIDASGATGSDRALILSQIHIHVNGTRAPDRPRALDAIAKFKPTWLLITVGQYQPLKWDTQGGWDTACWV